MFNETSSPFWTISPWSASLPAVVPPRSTETEASAPARSRPAVADAGHREFVSRRRVSELEVGLGEIHAADAEVGRDRHVEAGQAAVGDHQHRGSPIADAEGRLDLADIGGQIDAGTAGQRERRTCCS